MKTPLWLKIGLLPLPSRLRREIRARWHARVNDKRVRTINELVNIPPTVKCLVWGRDNVIRFAPGIRDFVGTIMIGAPDAPTTGCEVMIGGGSTANGVMFYVMEPNTKVTLGEDCMLSSDVTFYASDTHAILNSDGGLKNRGRFITIGNHCWIGHGASIMKNVSIPDGCIVGAHSVVVKSQERERAIIAGNPARQVTSIGQWVRNRPSKYL